MEIIYLTGMTGVGKTAVGRLLAQQLHVPFIDLDKFIERDTNQSISHIFEVHGEGYFRDLEDKTLNEVSKMKRGVISLGAGALEREENLRLIQATGKLIYLKADIELLMGRSLLNTSRPMLRDMKTDDELRIKLKELFVNREQRYAQADHIVEITDRETPLGITLRLMKILG